MKFWSFVGGAVVCLGALVGQASAASHRSTEQKVLSADTIRGVVFDSLQHQPLSGATVLAQPGGESALTDDQGRFTLRTAGRVGRVAVFHELLDRTGIGSLVVPVDSSSRNRGPVLVATPSLPTLWTRLCPGSTRLQGRDGILFGTAFAADGSTRVAGIRVRASWDSDSVSQAGGGAREVNTRTDSTGSFYACGVPSLTNVYVIGYSVEFSSGIVGLPGDSLPLRRQDVVVGAPGQTGTLSGIITGQLRKPLAGASIELD